MRVLITGITGFVGSHLADYILENHPEVEIHGLKRWRSPMDNIRHCETHLNLFDGDLCDLSSMLKMIGEIAPDWIFHLAAQSYVPFSLVAPNITLVTNIIGTANLLEAVRICKRELGMAMAMPRIHVCSSPEIYGQPDENDMPIDESCPLKAMSPYAVGKIGEDALAYMYYRVYGLDIVRSRAFTHTGPRRGEVFVVSDFAKQIAKIEKGLQQPIILVGNLNSVRTFCDVRDIVRAYWLLLEKGKLGEVYNIAGNQAMTVKEMLNRLIEISGLKAKQLEIKVGEEKLRPADVTVQIADDDKFRRLTGWEPQIPFSKTLEDTLNYWREKLK